MNKKVPLRIRKLMKELKARLSADETVDRAALAWLLKEELGKA